MIKIEPTRDKYCSACIYGNKDVKTLKYGSENAFLSAFNLCADCRLELLKLLQENNTAYADNTESMSEQERWRNGK